MKKDNNNKPKIINNVISCNSNSSSDCVDSEAEKATVIYPFPSPYKINEALEVTKEFENSGINITVIGRGGAGKTCYIQAGIDAAHPSDVIIINPGIGGSHDGHTVDGFIDVKTTSLEIPLVRQLPELSDKFLYGESKANIAEEKRRRVLVGKRVNLEYDRIQNKTSKLSRYEREVIVSEYEAIKSKKDEIRN